MRRHAYLTGLLTMALALALAVCAFALDKSADELAKEFEVSNNIAVSDLNGLSELGLVRRVGRTRGARYVLENQGPRNARVQTSPNRASGSGIRSRR
jgi:predicted ArsR family transcriptional regulator